MIDVMFQLAEWDGYAVFADRRGYHVLCEPTVGFRWREVAAGSYRSVLAAFSLLATSADAKTIASRLMRDPMVMP